MEERKIHQVLKKYRDENQKALKEVEVHLAATVSHFNEAIGKMEAASQEFASEISEHIVDLDVRLSRLEQKS